MLRSVLALFAPLVLVGCATTGTGPSASFGEIEEQDATAIAADLVGLLTQTRVQPARVPVSLAVVKDDTFGASLREQLGWAGYQVRTEPSDDAVALSYSASVMNEEGQFCIVANDGEGSICRAYRVPGAQAVSQVSAFKLDITAFPSINEAQYIDIGAPIDDTNFQLADEATIVFPNERWSLTPVAGASVQSLARRFAGGEYAKIKVVGVSKGHSRVGNQVLAEQRAHAVYDALIDAGVPANRLQIDIDYSTRAKRGKLNRGTMVYLYKGLGAWRT